MNKFFTSLLIAVLSVVCFSCGDGKGSNGDEPTPIVPGNPNTPTGSTLVYSVGTKLQSSIYDNTQYTYVIYVGFNVEKAFSNGVTEFGVMVSSADGDIAGGNSTSVDTYNKKVGSSLYLYGVISSNKSYQLGDYVYVTSSKSHIQLSITPRWYLHSEDRYISGSPNIYAFDADVSKPSDQENDDNDNSGDDDSSVGSGDEIEEQERWNEPLSYAIDGRKYDMILVERPGLRSFRIMQTELPVDKDIKIDNKWIDKPDRNGDGILIKSEFRNFLNDLRTITGCPFRLPRKDEWVFAANGGVKSKGYVYSGSNNLDEVGWYKDNSFNAIHEPKLKAANELKIYDMSGNYAELCNESAEDLYFVDGPICGGSYKDAASYCKNTSYKAGTTSGKVTGTNLKEKNAVDTRYIALRLVYYCNE